MRKCQPRVRQTATAGLNLINECDAVNDVSECQHKDKPHSDTSPRNRQFINSKTNEAKRQANSVSVRCLGLRPPSTDQRSSLAAM